MGAPAFRVPADRALACVFGRACGLDMTRRDLQIVAREHRRPWDLGKDFEQSAVLADIVPAADIGHPRDGRIELRVNGETSPQDSGVMTGSGVPCQVNRQVRSRRTLATIAGRKQATHVPPE
jgi:fumarylpyruvate hydrolase